MNLKKVLFIFVPICIIVFCVFYYIFLKSGNNKTKEKIVDYIINNYNIYEADISVEVQSNKNTNSYSMYQIVNHKKSKCIINSPQDIKGLTIENDEDNLIIKNEKYDMEKKYNTYNDILNNSIFLNTFINELKNNSYKIEENEDEIIINVELLANKNTYIKYKELYVDKSTKLPIKLIIKDKDKNTYISIIYNNIKIK